MGSSLQKVEELTPPLSFVDERRTEIPRGKRVLVDIPLSRVLYFTESCAELFMDGRKFADIQPGDILLLHRPSFQEYRNKGKRATSLHAFLLTYDSRPTKQQAGSASPLADFLERHLPDRAHLRLPANAEIPRLVSKIRSQMSDRKFGYRPKIEALCHLLLVALAEHLSSDEKTERESPSSRALTASLKDHIILNYSDDLNLPRLAKRLARSPEHLSRLFKSETGTTLSAFLRETRIRQACILLTTTTLPIQEIAASVGYQTPTVFNRNFARATGKTPRTYRQQHRDKPKSNLSQTIKDWL